MQTTKLCQHFWWTKFLSLIIDKRTQQVANDDNNNNNYELVAERQMAAGCEYFEMVLNLSLRLYSPFLWHNVTVGAHPNGLVATDFFWFRTRCLTMASKIMLMLFRLKAAQ